MVELDPASAGDCADRAYLYRDHYDQERYQELRLIAAEMMANGTGIQDSEKVLDLFRHERGYATPKIDVRGAVLRDDQVLLVRERDDGGWTLPGGWADVSDTPSAMVFGR